MAPLRCGSSLLLALLLVLPIPDVATALSFVGNVTARPSPEQLEWMNYEVGAMITFSLQSLCVPCGSANATKQRCQKLGCIPTLPALRAWEFAELDTDVWVSVAASFGAKYIVLVADHMSGFTLWPSRVHNVTIAATRYKGDVVASFRESCARSDIAAGFFYSAHYNWVLGMDTYKMGHPRLYGGPPLTAAEYEAAALAQLQELAAYGPWAEVWWDGGISLSLTPHLPALVREIFPDAMCHSCSPFTESAPGAGHGRGIRWVGNEEGSTPLPSWAASGVDGLPTGNPQGPLFIPASCDTVLEEHYWFYYPGDEAFLRSTCALSNVYLTSVGRATNLILNMAPLSSGGIAPHEVAAYAALGDAIACMWRAPIAAWDGVSVDLATGVASLPLPSPHTCAVKTGCELSLVLQEELASAGQRMGGWTIEARDAASGAWSPALSPSIPANATIGVGHKRIVVVRVGSGSSAPVAFDALRVVVATAYAAGADATAPLTLAHVALFDRAAGVQGCAALDGCTLVEY